jgi:adenylate cyclase
LEGIAEAGGICLSEDAYRQVRDKLAAEVTDLGEKELKNIPRPVRVYRVQFGYGEAALPRAVATTARAPPPKPGGPRRSLVWAAAAIVVLPLAIAGGAWYFLGANRTATIASNAPGPASLSIVVLPFANIGDPAEDYIVDAITEELTTALSRIRDSFVIARSTAFTYKGKPIDVKQVGRELGVRYVLEGSAQRSGDRVRVTAQLIDAETGAHLWVDQFDGDRADLLQMEDEVVNRLARSLDVQLTGADSARSAHLHGNPDAQGLAMRCRAGAYYADRLGSLEKLSDAIALCQQALELDPNNVLALVYYSYVKFMRPILWRGQSADPAADIHRADELLARALAIDPNFYIAHHWKAMLFQAQGRPEDSAAEEQRSLALNPSYVSAYTGLAMAHNFLGKPEEAITDVDRAMRLSPRDPLIGIFYWIKGWSLFMLHHDDQAVDWLRRSIAASPELAFPFLWLIVGLEETGQDAEAREVCRRYLALQSGLKTIAQVKAWQDRLWPSNDPISFDTKTRWFEGLRKAGMPEE